MKRWILYIFSFVSLFMLLGCDSEKPLILFSDSPFTSKEKYVQEDTFSKGQKIYYAIYNKEGFKTRLLKLQIFKKESEKSEFYGYEYLHNRTIELKNKNAYSDYIVINNAGFYIFQIFDYTDFQKPVILGIIKVE